MKRFFKEEELNNYSVHTLRDTAREFGVKSPSTLRKKELISAIINAPTENNVGCNSNRGRPIRLRSIVDDDGLQKNVQLKKLAHASFIAENKDFNQELIDKVIYHHEELCKAIAELKKYLNM